MDQKILSFVDEVANAIKSVGDKSFVNDLEKAEDLFQVKDVLHKVTKVTGEPLDDKFMLLGYLDNQIAMNIKELIIQKL
jgi:hypothetical protein